MENSASAGKVPHIAILLFKSSGTPPLYSEDFVLLYAESADEAERKAVERGRLEETSYLSATGETVTWTFERVVDVNAALEDDLTRDADLYSRNFRNMTAYQAFEPKLSGEDL